MDPILLGVAVSVFLGSFLPFLRKAVAVWLKRDSKIELKINLLGVGVSIELNPRDLHPEQARQIVEQLKTEENTIAAEKPNQSRGS